MILMKFNFSNAYYGFQLECLLKNYWHQSINYNEFNIFETLYFYAFLSQCFHLRFKIGFQKDEIAKKDIES
jgi:hypothetical protein